MFGHQAHANAEPKAAGDEAHELQEYVDTARSDSGHTDGPLTLQSGERRYFTLSGAKLVEPKRQPGHRVGGYAGPSFRVARGVYMHAGAYRGKTIPGAIAPTVIDTGTAVITDKRVVFLGEKVTRELAWAKVLEYEHDPDTRSTSFHVSNRQAVDAIGWGNASSFAFFADLAHAHYAGTLDEYVATLEKELQSIQATQPPAR